MEQKTKALETIEALRWTLNFHTCALKKIKESTKAFNQSLNSKMTNKLSITLPSESNWNHWRLCTSNETTKFFMA